MLFRVAAIAQNTYRENVRARLLHGLFGLAVATVGYTLVVSAYAFRDTPRVIGDVGGATVSLYGIVVAIILGATALYRELELKTAFPILARPVARWEYLVGKFAGTWLTLCAFVLLDTGLLLLAVSVVGGANPTAVVGFGLGVVGVAGLVMWRVPRARSWIPVGLALIWVSIGWWTAAAVPDERRVLLLCAVLALFEIAIVIAVAHVFSAFSTPFLSAMLTLGVVIVGRSADVLARLPARVFGTALSSLGKAIARVVPNTMVFVPPRTLMTGEMPNVDVRWYVVHAMTMTIGWVIFLLLAASLIFRRRDFT